MRILAGLVVLIIVAAPFCRAGDDVAKDLEGIQGTWKIVMARGGGKDAPPDLLKEGRFVITGDTIAFTLRDEKEPPMSYKLNPATNPKEIDLVVKVRGFIKGKPGDADTTETMLGIYELAGDDLVLCWGIERRPKKDRTGTVTDQGQKAQRPMTIEAAPDRVVFTLKREKK